MTKKVVLILVIVFTYTLAPAKDNSHHKQKTLSYRIHKAQKKFKAMMIKNKYSIKNQYGLR